MSTAIVAPSPTALQMSGTDPEVRSILSVLAKRTYRIEPSGGCVLAEEQLPLTIEIVYDADNPGLLARDTDVYPFKVATDVVVKGHAYAPHICSRFEASVRVGPAAAEVLVVGDRRCMLSSTGRVVFSEPGRVERVPLRHDRAYGGKDCCAERKYGNPFEALRPYLDARQDPAQASPYLYPRNPCGAGYLMELGREAVEGLRLPNLEDPEDRLGPDRLVVGTPDEWLRMPLPRALDWVDHSWFPRLAYLGLLPIHAPIEGAVAEVARGFAPSDLMQEGPLAEKFSLRFANGASLGLQAPYLGGNEDCLLTNLHPKLPRLSFRLPGERPRIWTDGRKGKLNETKPVLHTVLIEPDEDRVSLVWRGSAPALRPYMPEELDRMPFRVEWD